MHAKEDDIYVPDCDCEECTREASSGATPELPDQYEEGGQGGGHVPPDIEAMLKRLREGKAKDAQDAQDVGQGDAQDSKDAQEGQEGDAGSDAQGGSDEQPDYSVTFTFDTDPNGRDAEEWAWVIPDAVISAAPLLYGPGYRGTTLMLDIPAASPVDAIVKALARISSVVKYFPVQSAEVMRIDWIESDPSMSQLVEEVSE
jgi:hypothetical protein